MKQSLRLRSSSVKYLSRLSGKPSSTLVAHVPWPNSDLATRIQTVSSGSMTTHAVSSGLPGMDSGADVVEAGAQRLRSAGRLRFGSKQSKSTRRDRSVRTTEIYLKSLVPETVRPNEVPIIAEAK